MNENNKAITTPPTFVNGVTPLNAENLNKLSTAITETKSQLDEKENNNNSFLLRLLLGDIKKIKLIGDSITAGAQCSGYNAPEDGRLILQNSRFNQGGQGFARETGIDWNTFPCWANLFRKYIKTNYPAIDFFNAGVGGISLNEMLRDYIYLSDNKLVEDDEDVIFLMIGTNDRKGCSINDFEIKLEEIVSYLKTKCNTLILMSTPPTISEFCGTKAEWIYDGEYEEGYYFGSRELNMIFKKIANKHNLAFVNNYVKTSEYMSRTNSSYESVNSDKTHPNTIGNKIEWNNIQEELGIIGDLSTFIGDGNTDIKVVKSVDISLFSKLPVGVSKCLLLSSEAQALGLPRAGTIISIKPSNNSGYEKWTVQYFLSYQTGELISRGFKGTQSLDEWSTWNNMSNTNIDTGVNYTNTGILTEDLSKLKKGINIGFISNTDGSNNNFPLKKGGLVITVKPNEVNDLYVHQILLPYGVNRQYIRNWDGSKWSNWGTDRTVIIASIAGVVNDTTLLSDVKFEEGINYNYMVSGNTGFPNSRAGTLITHKPVNTLMIGYGYQLYQVYGSTEVWKRVWTSSNWGEWTKISL